MAYSEVLHRIKEVGFDVSSGIPQISVQNAREHLQQAASAICSSRKQAFVWSSDYEKVAQWLSYNEQKGLLVIGKPGNGKSLILDAVALVLFATQNIVCTKVVANEITTAAEVQTACGHKYLIIDDIGTENDLVDFGTRKTFVSEAIDAMERKGNIVMISTNLDSTSLKARYGERTYDRIRGNFKIAAFNSKSNR